LHTYADVLLDAGWANPEALGTRIDEWRRIMRELSADVVVMDHSPTVLLASQGEPVRRMLVGNGFFCPPDVSPLPDLRPVPDPGGPDHALAREATALETANQCLDEMGQPPLSHLASLFRRVDENVLATWPELDHYGEREDAEYWGTWAGEWGSPPRWPKGRKPRVFAYLKPFRALPALLEMLRRSGLAALVYLSGVDEPAARNLSAGNLRVVGEPVDLGRAAQLCALAILNASHGTTSSMLMAGIPILGIPLHLEQFLVAKRVATAGAGQIASQDAPDQISSALQRLLADPRFRQRAREIAARHASFDPASQVERIADRIETLADRES
jgi:UDP:flavonoid glycosyltransferase YjiC (YdhE family)